MLLWPDLILLHCLPTSLLMKPLRSSQINSLQTACILKALIAHNSPNFYSLAAKNCHFTFNDRIYQQIDGVAMGSPLGPLFANIFMSFHEKSRLYNCPSAFKPLMYRPNVHDCFLLFKSSDMYLFFLTILTTSILTSPSHPSWKKTASFLSSMLKYLA